MPTSLTRDAVVAGAVELADEVGAEALSMRRLAEHLGCGTMSLYNHVSDKDDLLGAALERVLAGVPTPTRPGDRAPDDWRDPLRALAAWLRSTLRAHPWAGDLWHTTWPGPNRTLLMEAVLGALRTGGFDRRMAHHGYHAFDLFVVGFVHQQVRFAIGIDDPEASMQRFLAETSVDRFPFTVEHVEHHADEDVDEDDFAFLLELLLDGLEPHR